MNINKGILKMLQSLNFSLANEKFENVETADGKLINISGREVGSEVMVADGEPLEDSTVELTDGFKFTVKDGKIDSIIEQDEVVEETVEVGTQTSEETVVDETIVEDEKQNEIEDMKSQIEDLKAQIAELKGEFDAVSNYATKEDLQAFQSELVTLNANVIKLASIPVEQSKVSQGFKENNKRAQDMAAIAAVFKK